MVDNSKAGPANDVRRKSEIDEVEGIKELSAELKRDHLTPPAPPHLSIFYEGRVEVPITWSPKGVPAETPKTSLIWPRTPRNADREAEECSVVGSLTEVVLANCPAG